MGKVRKRKHNKSSNDVMSTTHNTIEKEFVEDSENTIQILTDQLLSANVEERFCGLQTFTMLIDYPGTLQRMISCDLVKVIAPFLIDQVSSIRNAAAGCLRNLSAVHIDMCNVLMDHDIMTPLICYFHQYAESWSPCASSTTKNEDIDTFIHCTNVLLNLCESSDLAVKYVGNSKVLDIFPRYLDLSAFGSDIVIAVLQCLLVVMEDNSLAIKKINKLSEKQIKDLLYLDKSDSATLLIKVLASGIIINLSEANIDSLPVDIMNEILSTLAKTLSIDYRITCNQLSSSVPLPDATGKIEVPKVKEAFALDKEIKSLLGILDAQQNALEIIANICSCEVEEGSSGEIETTDSEADEPMNIDRPGQEMVEESIEDTIMPEDVLPSVVLEAFISLEIYEKVLAKTVTPPENVLSILNDYEGTKLIHRKLLSLEIRSLLCLNNLILSLPIDNVGGLEGVYKIWIDAGKLIFKKQNAENLQLLEAATAVMRTGINKMQSKYNAFTPEKDIFSKISISDIEMILTGIKECPAAEIRSNLIRMVGSLSLLLFSNLNETTTNIISLITEFILDQALQENEVSVLAEAVDTLVDLYTEDETDELAARVNLVDKLRKIAPILKKKARLNKKLPKEYKVLVTTANSNLPRFIKYKMARLSKL